VRTKEEAGERGKKPKNKYMRRSAAKIGGVAVVDGTFGRSSSACSDWNAVIGNLETCSDWPAVIGNLET
jgi:thiamine monophosphate kinase